MLSTAGRRLLRCLHRPTHLSPTHILSHTHRHKLSLSHSQEHTLTHLHIQDAHPWDHPIYSSSANFRTHLGFSQPGLHGDRNYLGAPLYSPEKAGVEGEGIGSSQFQGCVLIQLHRIFSQRKQNPKSKLFCSSPNIHSSIKEEFLTKTYRD